MAEMEAKYGMSTERAFEMMIAGELEETYEVTVWMVRYHALRGMRERAAASPKA